MSASKPKRDFFKTTLTTAFGTLGMAMGESAADVALATGIAYDKTRAFVKEALDAPYPNTAPYYPPISGRGFF